jgi:DNA-binding CsgD family transcriptional regulator
MDKLIKEYKQSLNNVRKLKLKVDPESADKSLLGNMASDLQYSLDWLQSGRCPGNRRGIERRAVYQRERPIDPIHIQNFVSNRAKENPCTVSDWDRQRIEDALSILTEREKEMYLMARGTCLSYGQISIYLFVCKSTVQTTVERAERKIAKRISKSLFCFCG